MARWGSTSRPSRPCVSTTARDPEALILRLCRELLANEPTEFGPTPLNVLGSYCLVRRVHRVPLAGRVGCSGLLIHRDGGYEATLDEDEPPGRQHRSLGHEIVHTFFREVHPGPPGPEEERLCELGAAELTMPSVRIQSLIAGRENITFAVVNACKDEFGVTSDAAARRLVELSNLPICYLVAIKRRTMNQERFNKGTPELRVLSWTCSRSWRERPYLGVSFKSGSLVADAYETQQLRAGHVRLGTSHRDGLYHIQAVGYTFPRRGEPYHQVAVLVRE